MNYTFNFKITLYIILFLIGSHCFGEEVYTFQAGDTLYSLSRRFGVSVNEIQSASGITDPKDIMVGTKIIIPNSNNSGSFFYYTIRSGDTLYSLSRTNNISINEIYSMNNLSESSILKIGMQIKIPVSTSNDSTNYDSKTEISQDYTQRNVNSDTPYWPHPGEIEELEGELSKAVVILGTAGDIIVSVSSGTVTWAGPFRGYGKMVFIKSPDGYVFGYGGHEELFVDTGDNINIGTKLGTLGINSHDGIAKVFFFVAKNGIPLKPQEAPRS